MKKTNAIILGFAVLGIGIAFAITIADLKNTDNPAAKNNKEQQNDKDQSLHPMAIEALRRSEYPGGEFTIEQTLSNGTNYRRYVASYRSEGLKIFGLLTVPTTPKPANGYPAIVFVHGYIPPNQYSTVNSYPTYQATLARAGFVTFKPDLRGHDTSEGEPVSAHYSEKYVIDTLYAISYLKQHPDVNPERIGYWGHSNGGEIGLRTILANEDIKAASFWAGVVGSYEDMFETYVDDISFLEQDNPLTREHGLPSENQEAWKPIEPYNYLEDVNIPIELQHGTEDQSVPVELSLNLKTAMESAGKNVVYHEYPGDDHNISINSGTAWQRSINFFREHL